ncbi:MAG: hypothetical protein JWR86_2819 [Enterovirga sp.]|nr:hypothetical protein [Enterovirga sp.]
MSLIYKICPAALWQRARDEGAFGGAPVDLADGYIHFSTEAQVAETAARHFGGQTDLLVLAVDPHPLGDALRWEPSRGGALFPHLYGPLPLAAVRSAASLPVREDGAHDLGPALWTRSRDEGFMGLVGPIWTSPDPLATRHGFRAERRHLNRGGTVHGGMLVAFADQALGLASWAANGDRPQVTIQLDTHFISGVAEGEWLEARCRVVRQTASLLFMTAELGVGERPVATATGIWMMRARPRGDRA